MDDIDIRGEDRMLYAMDLHSLPEVAKLYCVTRRTVWQIADPYHILIFVEDGHCRIQTEGEEYLLSPGDAFLIPENCLYLRRPVEEEFCTLWYYHFRLSIEEQTEENALAERAAWQEAVDNALLVGESMRKIPRLLLLRQATLSGLPEWISRLRNAVAAERAGNDTARVYWGLLLGEMLTEMASLTAPRPAHPGGRQTAPGGMPPALRRAVLYIRQHRSEKISLSDLCRECALSSQQMIRYFRAFFRTTPNGYILEYKMNKAKELLVNTPDLSVKEVAAELGYDDACYFSRVFTRCCGTSPTAYRTRVLQFDEKKHLGEQKKDTD